MKEFNSVKNNIILSDYDYQRDIENRLFMAELSTLEVDVICEILDGPLTISLKDLAKNCKTSSKNLMPIIEKLVAIKLITLKGEQVAVDKEMRKYYETQIIKFDDDFQPGIEFLQGLLSKVPIHVLPNWYTLPRMSDNIFSSIVNNYFLTPKNYEAYLKSLKFESPILQGMMEDIFSSSDLKVNAKTLIRKYKLSRAQFEEYMLLLEFNFVGCLWYNRVDDHWEEVITPFHEWRTYLLFEQNKLPNSIKKFESVKRFQSDTIHHETEEAIRVYRDLLKKLRNQIVPYTEKDIREVERSLKPIVNSGWIYFDEYMQGLTIPIGENEPVALRKSGKKWQYVLPKYKEEDHLFVKKILAEILSPAGIVALGTYNNKLCISVTPVGKSFL